MRILPALVLLTSIVSVPIRAGEMQENLAGWTLEERRNPAEARDYSLRLSKKVGDIELVAKRGAIRGRDIYLLLGDCVQVSFGADTPMLSVAQQIQSIRESAASAYESNREECKLPAMSAALLTGFDESYRTMDARFRAGRPSSPSLDRKQMVGGWALEDRKDEADGNEPGHRLISLAKTEGDLRLSYAMDVNLFFDSMFFTRNKYVIQYSDCRREQDLSSLDKEGPAEASARKAEIAASLQELQKDCGLPAAAASVIMADFAPALTTALSWARRHLADRAALVKVAEEYESGLDNARDAASIDAAADAVVACAIDAATGQPDPACVTSP